MKRSTTGIVNYGGSMSITGCAVGDGATVVVTDETTVVVVGDEVNVEE